MKYASILLFALIGILTSQLIAATTGKISGVIVDEATGEALPGVNLVVVGTTLGAVSDLDGFYVILNVPPGECNIKATLLGYSAYLVNNVRVQMDLTTRLDMKMKAQAIEGEEVTVEAKRPVVVPDISSSQANLGIDQVEALPIVSVASVVGLQAGIRGMEIRGGSIDQTAFVVNGITLRDERDNSPYTGISFTAVDEIQVQTGGFNAEFGNIRSGIVNVITKEGKKDRYTFGMISRYSPAAFKHFGPSPNAKNTFWIRPYVDEAVCWTGTQNGNWDDYTQKQYPVFEGWYSVSQKTLKDEDPNNDLTPEGAQKLFLWQHRRQLDIKEPDYDFDASFGGPVPLVGDRLGGMRFLASYRTAQEMYLIPLSKDGYRDYNAQLKLTSDLKANMKLMVEGIVGRATGTNNNNAGAPGLFRSAEGIASNLSQVSYIDTRMFCTDYWAPSAILRNSIAAKLTHMLNPSTFYEASIQRFESEYDTNPGRARDTSKVYLFGNNYWVDEAPFGFQPNPSTGIAGGDGGGMRMGVGMSNSRDSSRVTVYTGRFDITSQLNRYNNVKAGVEFVYTDNNVNYASVDKFLQSGRSQSKWHTFPKRGALFIQDKLEFEGMVANVGLRFDYSHAGGEWYSYDKFTQAFSAQNSLGVDTLLSKTETKRIYNLSPRLGVAFPISVNSKLFFNYGHFRQMPLPDDLYLFRRFSDNNAVSRLGNPNNPLPKTVAYELGYEQNLLDQFLIRASGYYKDISLQSRLVRYKSRDNKVNYVVTEPNNYQDIRGFELTLDKNRGGWVQGFLNYTYQVSTSGNFKFDQYSENPAVQRTYEREYRNNYQSKPIPRPYARANVYFFTPSDFGPRLAKNYLLGDLHLNVLADWRAGYYFTWAGGGSIPGISNNVQWRDYYNVNLRFSKTIKVAGVELQFFADVNNVFNFKYMTQYGFYNGNDYNAYMKSLHLPKDIGDKLGYGNIPGNDRPGDYRTVPYEPYDPNDPDKAHQKRVLETKAYIDMPNLEYFTFLNPRDIYWGIKVNFDIH